MPDHHREAVWGALNDGTIDMLSSDHAPHTRAEKEVGFQDCWACHTGTPGIQEQYPMLLDCSMDGLIPLTRVAEVVEQVRRFADVGVEHLVFDLRMNFDRWFASVELLGREVLPALRA